MLSHSCCNPFANLFACSGNAQIGLYRVVNGNTPELCLSDRPPNPFLRSGVPLADTTNPDRNPFLSAPEQIETVWQGRGFVTLTPAKEDRERWGRIENASLEIMIPRIENEIETGLWVYVDWLYVPDVQGGAVKQVERHLPTIYKMSVDISKPVPFAPETVGVQDWRRGSQC